MDHSEVRELLEDAAIEPGGLERLMAGDTPTASIVAGHLAGCADCAEELERLRRSVGLIRPEELKAGAIRHALVFSLPSQYVKGGGPVPPATESDGQSGLEGAIPEGARVQLAPSFDVKTLEHPWQRTIARALQVYGMYLADRGGGGVGLVAQNPQSYRRNPYSWGDRNYVYLPTKLISFMRILKLPPQYRPAIALQPSRCGVIR